MHGGLKEQGSGENTSANMVRLPESPSLPSNTRARASARRFSRDRADLRVERAAVPRLLPAARARAKTRILRA